MSGISHKQAIQLIHRHMDGLLNESQRLLLEEHLRSCDSCHDYANNMDGLSAHLQNEFHHRWDARLGPSQKVSEQVMTKTRNIPMTNRISSSVKLLAGAMALILLGVAINFVISQLQSTSSVTNATETVSAENRLLAFTSNQNGNLDIYTMRADGSGLTNLTNHPAKDLHPIWSPDGKHIAFESDRDGFMQIYRMDADGSNVVQLTRDEADHKLTLQYDGKYNPWSPDGNRLIFIQEESAEETGTLYSIDINGENEVRLANGRISPNYVSWSPDGKYIGYVLNVSSTPNLYVADTHVVEPDGSNARELKKLLPAGEQLDFFTPYYWSSNGQSIVFPALTSDPSREAVYELDLQTNTFLNETETKPVIEDWSAEVSLILDINQDGMPFVWERSDGTSNTFEASRTWGELCDLDFTRSPQNNFAFGVYCPDNKFNLYWTNADGSTIKQLLTLPIDVHVGDIAWSPDDQYIAFNITTADKTDMYVGKVEEMLANPSLQPLKVSITNETYSIPSWQPMVDENITKEIQTPQPTSTSSPEGLVAFTSEQNGNLDIYTVHPDGSGLTNLTNNSANNYSPLWSPNGQRIAFISERTGNADIFIMNPDGGNLSQLTDNPGVDGSLLWSPDGQKIVYLSSSEDDPNISQLMIMNADGSNQTALTKEPGSYSLLSFSPDGQKFIYMKLDQNSKNSGIYVVPIDGQTPQEGLLNENTGMHWEDSEHYLDSAWNGVSERSQWIVRRFDITDEQPLKPVEVASHSSPIIAFFGNMYVVESGTTLAWYSIDGNPTPLKSWNFNAHCKERGDQYIQETGHTISPDGTRAFVPVYCFDGTIWFYLENTDGSAFTQLTDFSVASSSVLERDWSPDGKYVIMTIANEDSTKTDLYLFDIEKMLQDPSTQPIQLTTGGVANEPVWQPIP